ncbi:unnamed protein product [Notodromas monacha]|uniref:NADH dehydrogenase [ubiquinone] 1 alpha subcomplex assembly factor 4 n=1 Tax=Notodromas monacha TaxID=399045 RepID=A0A7R9BTI1_9CRUS|nr:unnamed protein product [Notodromas monacha]CAG0921474.1 unnamed protein product [Notodromas monacha]
MGVAFSAAKRKVMRFNVEERAFKVLDSAKPKPAPHHPLPKHIREKERYVVQSDNKNIHEKNESLHERLKPLIINSEPYKKPAEDPNRPLPKSRATLEEFKYGLKEPEKVPPGRLTIRSAMDLLGKHTENPTQWNTEALAKHFVLKPELTQNVLDNFKLLQVVQMEEPGYKEGSAGPKISLAQALTFKPPEQLTDGSTTMPSKEDSK